MYLKQILELRNQIYNKKKTNLKIIVMAKNEKTSKSVASKASKLLKSPSSSKTVKSVAASALTQAPDRKKKKK